MRLVLGCLLLGLCLAAESSTAPTDPFDAPDILELDMDDAVATPKPEPPLAEPQPEPLPEPLPEPRAEPDVNNKGGPEQEPKAEPEPEPKSKSEPEPEPKAEPEPEPKEEPAEPLSEPEPKSSPEPEPEPHAEEPTPEPEPAIKFDNIESEDYGDVVESKNMPDPIDDAVITQLVDSFLQGGEGDAKNKGPKFANAAVHALVDSNDYWKTVDVKPTNSIKDEKAAQEWLNGYLKEAQKILHEVALAGWRYVSNAAPQTKQSLNEAEEALSRFVRSTAMQGKQFDASSFTDEKLKKLLSLVTFEGMSALSAEDYMHFNQALSQVNQIATNASICDKDLPPPCALKKVDLESIFHNENDASRLSSLWVNYVANVAPAIPAYAKTIELSNKGAKINGFKDAGALWRSPFDLSTANSKPVFDFRKQIENIYMQIEPFYKQLHAYMRRQISGIYQNAADLSKDGPIPAHLFGSVEGGDWSTHYEQTKPYDDEDQVAEDILQAFHVQNYTAKTMFIKAYRYFKSIGFPPLPKTFWTNSHFSRVWSKDMICNPPAAIDMRDGVDFRVKSCAQLGEPDFELAHSLMAQVYYQYLYRDQPLLFREAAASSVSEAIARVFAHLSTNPHYLYAQKLVPASHLDIKDATIVNRLYKEALENFVKLPFSIAADEWRYDLFEGKTPVDRSNDLWWQLRTKYEGVRAPQPYNSSNIDALMHSSVTQTFSPAVRNVVSYIAQFQILKSICPEGAILSEGCILSEDTTEKLRETMKLGSSITWLKALEMITGKGELDPSPLLEYFEPLDNWLRNTNEIDQVVVGWDGEGTPFSPEDIPKPRSSMDGGSGILSEDRVAFPGGECTHGQECLLESHCNGTMCVCNEGLFTLELGNTFNCVPEDPKQKGFLSDEGGIQIGLFESATTPTPEPTTTTSIHIRKASALTSLSIPFISFIILSWLM